MKKILTTVAACLVSLFSFVPNAHAQTDKVSTSIGYVGTGFQSSFDYPKKPGLVTGKSYDANGLDLTIKVSINDILSVGYRRQNSGLRNATFFDDFSSRGGRQNSESDTNQIAGASNYQEIFGSFVLPKSHDHSLIVGLAKAEFHRDFRWDVVPAIEVGENLPTTPSTNGSYMTYSSLAIDHIGLVVGGSGKQKIGNVVFDYVGRFYPRLARTDQSSSPEQTQPATESTSSGYEVRGTVTWFYSSHIGLTGGYQFRQFKTKSPNDFWPINETLTDKGFVVATSFSF